jgi:hypothetical protein
VKGLCVQRAPRIETPAKALFQEQLSTHADWRGSPHTVFRATVENAMPQCGKPGPHLA